MTGDAYARPLEEGVRRDFSEAMSYGDYLRLDLVLGAQQPLSDPLRHDEMLFIIQHQVSELWLKLMLHELREARSLLARDDLSPALKCLARVEHIQHALIEQWGVLSSLTPSEYAEFRGYLQSSSGFQSWQYRAVEFILGNKDPQMLQVFEHDPQIHALLTALYDEPTIYDEFLRFLHRLGHPIPREILERDVQQRWHLHPSLVPVFLDIYDHTKSHWREYEACETLVDVEDNFQLWRFRHLKTVERIIGSKSGSGGSSGVPFLRKALDLTFFPELYAVRAEIGS
ncbi:MAG TPA: tryptophan 2,3-dioxygenase [Actinobacteria bacterium]|jgi:tryptophan 2,3-dioxygenase|nr:tryptophan 2,3-dioxygenase [Actinomycetota bacterium]